MSNAAPRRPSTAGLPSRRAFLAAAAGCLLLLAGAYANAFHNAFQFDDNTVIVQNLFLRSLRNVPAFFADARTYTTFAPNMTYRPLVSTTFAIDYAIGGGLSPPVFHATNLLLLAILWGLLVAFHAHVMERAAPSPANRWLALFAATWFCVHVVNTETMNVMYNRSELLSTIGLVAAFVVYWTGRGAPRRWLSLVPMAVGAFAKIPSILFAPLLVVWEYLEPSGEAAAGGGRLARLRGALRVAAPALAAAVLLYAWVEWAMHVPGQWYGGPSRDVYALTQTWAWVHYLRLFFVPVGLTADTDLAWIRSPLDPRVLAGVAVILGLCGAIAVTARRRRWHPIAFGLAWHVIGLLPASSVLPISEPVNEHRAFVAHVGLTLAVVWAARLGLGAVLERMRVAPRLRVGLVSALCLLVLGGHAVAVHVRNKVYRTQESFWRDVTEKSPGNPRGWMSWAIELLKRERFDQGEAALRRALALDPRNPDVHVNLGVLLAGVRGDASGAERHFRLAVELSGGDRPAPYDLYARFLVDQGRIAEALPLLARSLQIAPGGERARRTLSELQASGAIRIAP